MTLSANGIHWTRGDSRVLENVTVSASAGETIGLLGPNGSGKSSLLRVLAGVARPDAGEVTLDGRDIRALRRRHLARRVAVVDQHAHTDVDVSVLDVVRLGRIPHRGMLGSDSAADDAAVEAALTGTGMADKRRRTWQTLSGGERQRVQIARALAQEPDHLLLDEPTNHLDIAHQLEILAMVSALPVTSYIALHDLNLAAMFCDRVVVLRQGRIVATGTPRDVVTADLVRDVYNVAATVSTGPDGTAAVHFHRPGSGRRSASPARRLVASAIADQS